MALFGKKKSKEEKIKKEVKVAEEEKKEITLPQPAVAELYVKLEEYEEVLDSLSQLKRSMVTIKNAFSELDKLNRTIEDNLKEIQGMVDRVENKLMEVDSKFIRPPGYEEIHEEVYVPEELDTKLTELQEKVSQIKSELENVP